MAKVSKVKLRSEAEHWRKFHKCRSSNEKVPGSKRPVGVKFMLKYRRNGRRFSRPTGNTGELLDHEKLRPDELLNSAFNLLGQNLEQKVRGRHVRFDGKQTFFAVTQAFNEFALVEEDLRKLLADVEAKEAKEAEGQAVQATKKYKRCGRHKKPSTIQKLLDTVPIVREEFKAQAFELGLARLENDDVVFDDFKTTRKRVRALRQGHTFG